jgi:tetratricopeptide (TPR) repeat protein
MGGIFISHTHSDQPLANAINELIKALFGQNFPVNYSSKKELEGGIAPGDDWFRWIVTQVREVDTAFILLTPSSIQKPWVIWEAGAVAGAAFATESAEQRRVYPISYGVTGTQVPSPFARTQLISGTDPNDVLKLVDDLFERFGKNLSPIEIKRFGEKISPSIEKYISDVSRAIVRLPLVVTEAVVQEWLSRLDDFKRQQRFSEAKVLENWLDIAFGREEADKLRPLDARVHRRLGELYALAQMPSEAARQWELARQLSPRDIMLLRMLGKAFLDQKDSGKAEEILNDIETLDKDAFERNPENAALKARWYEQRGDLLGAKDVLKRAYHTNPRSYYIGDLLGQTLLRIPGCKSEAIQVYDQILKTIEDLPELNVWTYATSLTASVVLENQSGIEHALGSIANLRPTPSRQAIASIEKGIEKLEGVDEAIKKKILERLGAIVTK